MTVVQNEVLRTDIEPIELAGPEADDFVAKVMMWAWNEEEENAPASTLSTEQLDLLRSGLPGWRIHEYPVAEGSHKVFLRSLDGVDGVFMKRDAAVAAANQVDHFEDSLTAVFDPNKVCGGGMVDGELHLQVNAVGPITEADVASIWDAETFLQTQGLVLPCAGVQISSLS